MAMLILQEREIVHMYIACINYLRLLGFEKSCANLVPKE